MVRHKVKSGNLFLCLAMIVLAVGSGYAQTDDVRKELEAVFAKGDQAELKKDFSYWKSLETADYREKSKDGSVRDKAAADARIEKLLPSIKEVREQVSKIETVRPGDAKGEYVVEARSNFALTMAAKGYPREFKGSDLTRDIWVRTPEGWKIKYREELDSSVDLGAKGNLTQRLQSQYVLSKVSGSDITPGTVLTLQKPGLTGCSKFALTNNYKDSRLKQSFGSGLAAAMMGSDNSPTRSFDVGEAVYLVKISVKDNSVDFIVITREIYDGAHYGASVSFQFPKGYLASADPAKVQETIAELVQGGGGAKRSWG
jgi:hypothetical protein